MSPLISLFVQSTQKKEGESDRFKTVFESDRKLVRRSSRCFIDVIPQGVGNDQRATAVADYSTDLSHDHRAILERNEAIGKNI